VRLNFAGAPAMSNPASDSTQFGVSLKVVLSRYGEHIIPRLLKEMVMILFQCGT
jgi:hypothetical protein